MLLAAAGHRVLGDGEGPPRPPRPAPAQRSLLAAADRQIQYVSPVPISRLVACAGFWVRHLMGRGI